jgi:hypothetical protein
MMNTHHYTGGRSNRVADLLADGSHRVEVWGNYREGFQPMLVSTAMPEAGCSIGERYRSLSGLRLDVQRTYGRGHKVRFGRCW